METITNNIGEITLILLSFRDEIKIYHWNTHIYARHKATDKLLKSLTELIDKFVEVLQGSRNERISINSQTKLKTYSDTEINTLLDAFTHWLSNKLDHFLKPNETDLRNIRDEMLAIINQTKYLFTLN
jgi:hypothetical protein